MNNSYPINFLKLNWLSMLSCAFVIMVSCNQRDDKKQMKISLPTGKWKIIQMQSGDTNILLDASRNYTLEHQVNNKLIVTAEDNVLKGHVITITNGHFELENISKTDVCCNTKAADLLFKFFEGEVSFQFQGSKISLTSADVFIRLER